MAAELANIHFLIKDACKMAKHESFDWENINSPNLLFV